MASIQELQDPGNHFDKSHDVKMAAQYYRLVEAIDNAVGLFSQRVRDIVGRGHAITILQSNLALRLMTYLTEIDHFKSYKNNEHILIRFIIDSLCAMLYEVIYLDPETQMGFATKSSHLKDTAQQMRAGLGTAAKSLSHIIHVADMEFESSRLLAKRLTNYVAKNVEVSQLADTIEVISPNKIKKNVAMVGGKEFDVLPNSSLAHIVLTNDPLVRKIVNEELVPLIIDCLNTFVGENNQIIKPGQLWHMDGHWLPLLGIMKRLTGFAIYHPSLPEGMRAIPKSEHTADEIYERFINLLRDPNSFKHMVRNKNSDGITKGLFWNDTEIHHLLRAGEFKIPNAFFYYEQLGCPAAFTKVISELVELYYLMRDNLTGEQLEPIRFSLQQVISN